VKLTTKPPSIAKVKISGAIPLLPPMSSLPARGEPYLHRYWTEIKIGINIANEIAKNTQALFLYL
jgi:hypothetical protein